jgi:hypothetical protein
VVGVSTAARWNGRTWKSYELAASYVPFAGVACWSTRACVAVGTEEPTPSGHIADAQIWNGKRWRDQPGVDASNDSLLSVSCTHSAVKLRACYAVGFTPFSYYYNEGTTFAAQFNGLRWSAAPTPNPGGTFAVGGAYNVLQGVSCSTTGGRDVCIAVGAYRAIGGIQHTLAETLS